MTILVFIFFESYCDRYISVFINIAMFMAAFDNLIFFIAADNVP